MDIFDRYIEILLRENAKHNLTAITEPEEVRQKHFADSLALLEHLPCSLPASAAVIDVGSGAGFPGVPLAIARPEWRVTLLEATAKKAKFLSLLKDELGLPLTILNARAEIAAHDPMLREQFDLVVSRAVASLPVLCELCLPFVRPGGLLAAYKGTAERTNEELALARRAIEVLGGAAEKVVNESSAYGERTIVMLRKLSQSPAACPRNFGNILKRPL